MLTTLISVGEVFSGHPMSFVTAGTDSEGNAKEPHGKPSFVEKIVGFEETIQAGAVRRVYFRAGVFDGIMVELQQSHAFGADSVVAHVIGSFV
jgi:hypothetical protein